MPLIIDEPEVFINNIQNQLTIYTLLMMPESVSSTTAIYVVNKTLMLLQQYNKYTDMFSKENADKLSSH